MPKNFLHYVLIFFGIIVAISVIGFVGQVNCYEEPGNKQGHDDVGNTCYTVASKKNPIWCRK